MKWIYVLPRRGTTVPARTERREIKTQPPRGRVVPVRKHGVACCFDRKSGSELPHSKASGGGLLVLFGGGGDTHAAEFIGIVFAEEKVPLLAAFEDFFFLGRDALADFDLDLFFLAEDIGDGLDDVLADGVAVLDKLDFIALHEKIGDLIGDADNFFAAQSHHVCMPRFPSPAANTSG